MPIYELKNKRLKKLPDQNLSELEIKENVIKEILREEINVLNSDSENSSDLLVISEEFGDWEGSGRKIDLLCVDNEAKLVVVELKRGDGSYMELQSIRYSAMVSDMDFDQAVKIYEIFLEKYQKAEKKNARTDLLSFMEQTEETVNDVFGNDVRIILVSETFSREIKTTALWLNSRKIDVRCVRMIPYEFDKKILINFEEIIPGQETEIIKVALREEERKKKVKTGNRDYTKFDLQFDPPFDSQIHEGLAKNRVIHRTVQYLVNNGVSPEKLEKECVELKGRFLSVSSDVDSEEFMKIHKREASKKIKRYFFKQEELLKINNKTYALSNGWGGRKELENMIKFLNDKFPQFDIQLKAVESED